MAVNSVYKPGWRSRRRSRLSLVERAVPRLGRSPVPEIESKPFSSKTQTADGDDQDQAATSSETPPAPDDPEIVDGGIHDLELGGGEQSGLDIELFESEVLLPAIGEHAAPSSDAVEDPETSKEPAAGNDGGNAVEDSLHDDMLSELGADDFIDDPIAPEALSQAVQTLPSEADEESAEPTVGAPSTDFEQGTDGEEWQHAGREPHERPPLETGRGGDQADGSQEESSAPAIDPEAPDAAVDIKLDWPALVALGFVDPRDPKRPLPSNMDKIARALVRQALSDQSSWRDRVILVTSAEEHKIKSDAAINFAFALTTIDRHSVVLLDANMSHAGSAKRLGAPNARGLTSALCDDDLDVGELVLKANLDRLTLMASGPAEDEILDRFASRRMLNVLRYLTKDPDTLLVIDAPPILISQEAAVLAVIAGQVILAVEAGKTTADSIDHALKRIGDRPNVSLVLHESAGLERRGADVSYGASDQSDRLPDSAYNRPKRRLPSAALVIAALATGLGIAVSADSHRLPLTSWHGTEMHDVSGSGTNLDPLEKSFSIP